MWKVRLAKQIRGLGPERPWIGLLTGNLENQWTDLGMQIYVWVLSMDMGHWMKPFKEIVELHQMLD